MFSCLSRSSRPRPPALLPLAPPWSGRSSSPTNPSPHRRPPLTSEPKSSPSKTCSRMRSRTNSNACTSSTPRPWLWSHPPPPTQGPPTESSTSLSAPHSRRAMPLRMVSCSKAAPTIRRQVWLQVGRAQRETVSYHSSSRHPHQPLPPPPHRQRAWPAPAGVVVVVVVGR